MTSLPSGPRTAQHLGGVLRASRCVFVSHNVLLRYVGQPTDLIFEDDHNDYRTGADFRRPVEMLGEMAMRVTSTRAFEETIKTILDDVVAFHGAQYGNVQLPVGDNLVIAAQRGFGPEFLQTFQRVKRDDGCACGRALRLCQSIVISHVENEPDFAPYRNAARRAGFRSVRSTPLITHDNKLVGIVSTHFVAPNLAARNGQGAFEGFHLYGAITAEQACELLNGAGLAAKAAQMSGE